MLVFVDDGGEGGLAGAVLSVSSASVAGRREVQRRKLMCVNMNICVRAFFPKSINVGESTEHTVVDGGSPTTIYYTYSRKRLLTG